MAGSLISRSAQNDTNDSPSETDSDPGEGPERRVPQVLLRLDPQDHGRAEVEVGDARNGRAESQAGCLAVAYSRNHRHRARQAERAGKLS